MPNRAPNDSRIVSVRLPDDLIQRLDRYLDWCATSRRRNATRNAAIREALRAWLDDHEQRAGLVEPHTLQRQFQAAYQRLHLHHDGVPIHRLRQLLQWPRERFDAVLEALRADHHVKRALRLPDWPARPRTLINCLDSGLERVDKIAQLCSEGWRRTVPMPRGGVKPCGTRPWR